MTETELERLERDYDEKRYKFEATSDAWSITYDAATVVYDAAMDAAMDAARDAAEAVRATATRATEEAWNIAVREMRVAALALDEARKGQEQAK